MPSKIFEILNNERDPRSVLENLMIQIVAAERCYPLIQDARRLFAEEINCPGRQWGANEGSLDEIDIIRNAADPGFMLNYSFESYSRGCHMGTSRFKIFIPDLLVTLYEEHQDHEEPTDSWAVFQAALELYTKERVSDILKKLADETNAAAIKLAEAQEATNAHERQEFARLSEKFGS